MTERNKLNRIIKEMTRLKPKQERKEKKNPLVPNQQFVTEITTLKDRLFDSIKISNLMKSDIKTRYKRALVSVIPKINIENRKSKRAGKWLEITDFKIMFDEHGRTEMLLVGRMPNDEYLNEMTEDNYNIPALKAFKSAFDISTLTITGKSNYNEFEV